MARGAGRFRTLLWLQRPIVGTDAAGAPTYTWDSTFGANTFKAWGDVQPLRGRELAGEVVKDFEDVSITVRKFSSMPTVDPTWRVFDPVNGITYAVHAAVIDQKNTVVALTCRTAIGESDGR